MLSKNIYAVIILLFCSSAHCAENNPKSSFYLKGSYFGVFGNVMNDLSGKEDAGDITEGIISFSTDGEVVEGYKPKYTAGLAGGGAICYSLNEMQLSSKFVPSRVELEILHSQINLDVEDYFNNKDNKESAKDFMLFRNNEASTISSNNPILQDNDIPRNFIENHGTRVTFEMKNNGFYNLSGLVNIYYDLNINSHLVPYISSGLGLTKVKFLERSKYTPAFQLKAGVHYALNDKMQMFAGLRYFGIFNNQFKNILPMRKIIAGGAGQDSSGDDYDDSACVASTTATVNHRFGIYGLEVGMVYNF